MFFLPLWWSLGDSPGSVFLLTLGVLGLETQVIACGFSMISMFPNSSHQAFLSSASPCRITSMAPAETTLKPYYLVLLSLFILLGPWNTLTQFPSLLPPALLLIYIYRNNAMVIGFNKQTFRFTIWLSFLLPLICSCNFSFKEISLVLFSCKHAGRHYKNPFLSLTFKFHLFFSGYRFLCWHFLLVP